MGRAPFPGGPQRVSAHVVPKAKPFREEGDRTAVERHWEEEPSTTIDQVEVAEKVRAFVEKAQTTTGSGVGLEEPTIDQHLVLSALTPVRADSVARLVITLGNDTGRTIEVRPG